MILGRQNRINSYLPIQIATGRSPKRRNPPSHRSATSGFGASSVVRGDGVIGHVTPSTPCADPSRTDEPPQCQPGAGGGPYRSGIHP